MFKTVLSWPFNFFAVTEHMTAYAPLNLLPQTKPPKTTFRVCETPRVGPWEKADESCASTIPKTGTSSLPLFFNERDKSSTAMN